MSGMLSVAGYLASDAGKEALRRATTPSEQWDAWYASLPDDLRRPLSIHDFKRLGDCFKAAFGVA
jgi:hypothetical protein